MFELVPCARSDKAVYFVAGTPRGLADEECETVLGNVLRASAETGAPIAIMETLVPEVVSSPHW